MGGIFYRNRTGTSGRGQNELDVLYFDYDHNGAGPDDNHDDLIISLALVPDSPPAGRSPDPEASSFAVWGLLAGSAVAVAVAVLRGYRWKTL